MRKRFGYSLAALAAAASLALAPALAHAAVVPVINVVAGTGASNGGVAGYYLADDGHTHFRYTQVIATASPTLNNLNGVGDNNGAIGTELCDENGNNSFGQPDAAQIGLWFDGANYHVSYAFGPLKGSFDDNCIDSGVVLTPISSAMTLLSHMVIHQGDRVQLGVYYDPTAGSCSPVTRDAARFGGHGHELSFSATDLSQLNEHRQFDECVSVQDFTEAGDGVVSGAAMVTAPALNTIEQVTGAKVNFYSATHPAYPISQQHAFYGFGGLTEVNYVNSSTQPEISPNNSLVGASFTISEGSTTP